jgi:hemerythrin-like domain-containing protein
MNIPSPSVAQNLDEAHTSLLQDLRQLEETAATSPLGQLSELSAALEKAQTHVREHFRFEEENGYMDSVRKREPRFERTIQQLVDEHQRLLRSLERLIGQANKASRLVDVLFEKVRGWMEKVRQHEARETELVQNAFNNDISAED